MSAKIKTFMDENGNQILPRTNAKAVYMSDSSTTVEDALKIQPDWNQNNLEAKDYIKNRTHYKIKSAKKIFNSCGIDFNNYTFTVDEYGCLYLYDDDMIYNHSYFSDCGIYTVILDGIEYKFNIGEWGGITNGYLTIDTWLGGISFCFEEDGEENSTHTISIYEEIETYYPLNKKYIPNSVIKVQSVFDENYEIIRDEVTNKTVDEIRTLWRNLMSHKIDEIPQVMYCTPYGTTEMAYLQDVNDGDMMNMIFRGSSDGYSTLYVNIIEGECYVRYEPSPVEDHNTDNSSHEDIRLDLSQTIYKGMPNSLPVTANWSDISVCDDEFVVVSNAGDIASYSIKYSDAWSKLNRNEILNSGVHWKSMAACYNDYGGCCHAITSSNMSDQIAMYSGGGVFTKTLPHAGNWDHIVYGANKFIVLDSEISNQGAYSDDEGYNWKEITLPVTAGWGTLIYDEERFVALANKTADSPNGSNVGMWSEDGINWTAFTMPASMIWTGIAQDIWYFYAFGYDPINSTSACFQIPDYSSDFNSWDTVWSYDEIKSGPIAYNENMIIRLKGNSLIEYTTNVEYIKNWTELTIPEGEWTNIKYCNGMFFILGNNINKFAYSKNGIDWIVDNLYLFDNRGNGLIEDLKETLAFPGKKVEGLSFNINDEDSYAQKGAEIFNDYENNVAIGANSHAEGEYSIASGYASHAEGEYTIASGEGSHAEGAYVDGIGASQATGLGAHAEGIGTIASGDSSHAEGYACGAYGIGSHAEGMETMADEYGSHAEGMLTKAYGICSHAEGLQTQAKGNYSHAEGGGCWTDYGAEYSHAEGWNTFAGVSYQHVQGKNNIIDTTSAHIVGNGELNQSSNAHTLDWSGNAWFAGDVYVGSASGKNKDEGSKKLATEEFVNNTVSNTSTSTPNWRAAAGEPGYIENRTHYISEKLNVVLEPTTETSFGAPGFSTEGEITEPIIAPNKTYEVTIDGTKYRSIAYYDSGTAETRLGDSRLSNDEYSIVDHPEEVPYLFLQYIALETMNKTTYMADITYADSNTHTISIAEVTDELEYHTLDINYLPMDAIAANLAPNNYLPLTGGTMSGAIYSNGATGFVQQMNDTSNWRNAIAWRNATPETFIYYSGIGRHNTGGNSTYPGSISVIPYATDTQPWGGTVGLFITKDLMQFEGNKFIDSSGKVYGAIWNDYAEYRTQTEEIEPGYCAASSNSGKLNKTNSRLQACDGIVSDTFGFAIGETDDYKTPLAVAGRVLAYCEGDRYDYNAGDAVCATAGGLVSKMTREEIKEYPDRIVGIVSEIPEYDTWGTGNVKVNGRIWIKVK